MLTKKLLPALAVAALAGVLTVGCGDDEGLVNPDDNGQPEGGAESGPVNLTGTWTRDTPAYVFEVVDDGSTVSGTLVSGGAEDLARYEFQLIRGADGRLQGSATIVFANSDDYPESELNPYELEWREVSVGPGEVVLEQQWVEETEETADGKIDDRDLTGFDRIAYVFQGVDQPASQPAGPDYTQFLTPVSMITFGPGAGVGLGVTMQVENALGSSRKWRRIVNETDEVWHVEESIDPALVMGEEGLIMGYVVEKASGKVLEAMVGREGEPGRKLDVPAIPETPAQPEGVDEEVTVAAGTYPSKKIVTDNYTSWSGVEGEVLGVALKFESEYAKYELAEIGSANGELDDGALIQVQTFRYDNGQEFWLTSEDEVVLALQPYGGAEATRGQFKFADGAGNTSAVISRVYDAVALLDWSGGASDEAMDDGMDDGGMDDGSGDDGSGDDGFGDDGFGDDGFGDDDEEDPFGDGE